MSHRFTTRLDFRQGKSRSAVLGKQLPHLRLHLDAAEKLGLEWIGIQATQLAFKKPPRPKARAGNRRRWTRAERSWSDHARVAVGFSPCHYPHLFRSEISLSYHNYFTINHLVLVLLDVPISMPG